MDKSNRIFFNDNPYPNGHKIKEFIKFSGFEFENKISDTIEKYLINSDLFEIRDKMIIPKTQ